MRRLLAALALVMVAGLVQRAPAETARDPAELARTWQAALVYLPGRPGGYRATGVTDLPGALTRMTDPRVVLYAHGCSGIIDVTHAAGAMYAAAGYVFVAPDGFARMDKPLSCRPGRQQGGLHRAVLAWRQAEIDHALRRLRALPGLDAAPIALVGHSEGATAVATIETGPVAARVIEGWTCHAGWSEYIGVNAPAAQPVLSLVGNEDPWFRHPVLRGECGAFMDGNDLSIVFRGSDPRAGAHWLSWDTRVQEVILDFLAAPMSVSAK